MRTRNRILTLVLALVMAVSCLPITTLAEEPENTETTEIIEPTEKPTVEPTEVPAEDPTEEPTEAPAEEPAEEPTEAPAEEPAEEPTEEATEEPIGAPNEEPTEVPTEEPTEEPTESGAEVAENATEPANMYVYAKGTCGNNLTWVLDDSGTLTISGTGEMGSRTWGSYTQRIKCVIIEEGVTSIGDEAFQNCYYLTSVSIPGSVTSVGEKAFSSCYYALTSVTIPEGVTSIKSNAFEFCRALTSVTLPEGLTFIGEYVFWECSSLTSINIPGSVTSMWNYIFKGCVKLASVTLGEGLTSIGDRLFFECSRITSIHIPNSVTSIGSYAFYGCTGLTTLTIPGNVTSIGYGAFSGCTGLTNVILSEGVAQCPDFTNCTGLTTLTIPASVTSIYRDAFSGCSNLTDIYYGDTERAWNALRVNVPENTVVHCVIAGTCGENLTWRLDNSGTLTISGTGDMDYGSWSMYSDRIKNVIIKEGATSIKRCAFQNCYRLTSITIPNGVTKIEEYAFDGCSQLPSITIPASVTYIGSCVFSECKELADIFYGSTENAWKRLSVTIPTKTVVHYTPYVGVCGKNLTWTLEESTGVLTISGTGNMYYRPTWDNYAADIKMVVFPQGITSIGDYAFSGCSVLTSIVIPNGVTSIGEYAFYNCTSLTSITIPDRVDSIGANAFEDCSELTAVNIPNGVTVIENYTFSGCKSLRNLSIPIGVTDIGRGAFNGCSGLYSINIPESVTSIWGEAFRYCTSLTSITIPNGVTAIGDNTFYCCENLRTVSIPTSITSIGKNAFAYCSSLTSVTIPGSVTSIDLNAFCDCSRLRDIYYGSTERAWKDLDVRTPENTVVHYTLAGVCGKNLTWTLEESTGVLTIMGTGDMSYRNGYSDYPWYDYAPKIQKIVFPQKITSIGNYAFNGCTGLTSVSIPSGVTSIGNQAFNGCTGLTSVTIPNSVYSIGYSAFRDCTGLTSVSIPFGVISIEDCTFYGCTSLTGVSIPQSVTGIGSHAFFNCKNLKSVTIPARVASIGEYAFSGDAALKKIVFQGEAPTFGNGTFGNVVANAHYPVKKSTWTNSVLQNYGGTITWKPYSEDAPAVPYKPYKIANVVSGVHVYWERVPGVEKYGLWRSETGINGTYKWIANPTVPHFTDTNVVSGKTYYYKVTSLNPITGAASEKSAAIGVTYVSTPDIKSRTNVAAGVQLGWDKVSGATGYAIYRKSYSGSDAWVRVGTVSGNGTDTWTDGSVKNNNGEAYRYTIRALAGSDMKTLSGCRNTGRTMVRLSSQVLKSVAKASATSAKATWTTSSRVTGYEVRFLVGNTVYKTFTVGNWKTGVKTFTGLKNGQTYTVQVRTYKKVDGVGSFYSDWSAAKTVTLK